VSFGGGDSLIIAGVAGNDNVTMTASQIADNGSAAITYNNVAFFAFALGTGANSLLIDHATLILNQNNAISAGTNVTMSGGMLNYNGYADAIGNLVITGGGQVIAGSVTNTVTTVTSGALTVGSIVSDALTIGEAAAAATAQPAKNALQNSPAVSSGGSGASGALNSVGSMVSPTSTSAPPPVVVVPIFANVPPSTAALTASVNPTLPIALPAKLFSAVEIPDTIVAIQARKSLRKGASLAGDHWETFLQ
jgi:hypothetical protein